jgi:leukotriene-A4 hydrolase
MYLDPCWLLLADGLARLFLDTLLAEKPLAHELLARLDAAYSLSAGRNVELGFRFFRLALRAADKSVFPALATFLSKHGRGLYVKPLYSDLMALDLAFAKKTFQSNRPFYHSVIRNAFDDKLLH